MSASETKAPQLVAVDFDPFAQGEVATMAPTTNGQREIWTAVQMEPVASLCFNESFSLRLRGPLDVERLRAAFRRVLERHAALRSTFTPDGLWLCISNTLPASLSLVDLSTLAAADQAQTMAERARLEVELPFNLVHGPLVRAQFFRLSSDEHVLFFTAHHIVCDGWSHWVVMTELAALYSGRDLPEPDSFARYASEDGKGQNDEAYWLQRFADGAPSLDLPADRPRPRARTYDSAREDLVLPESLVEGLQKLGARHGASLVATLLAGYAAFLHRLTGQEDLVIGVPASGQARTGQHHLVGHCISLLPVRLAVESEQPFTDLLRSVRSTFLDALEHQRPSFGRLLESLRLARDPGRIPLVSASFNMDRSAEKLDFQGLDVSYASHPRRYETFELFINASVGTGRFVLAAQYNANLFEADTVRRLCRHFAVLLEAIVRDPDLSISRLPMLAEADRQQLLVEWNRTEADYPRDVPLGQLVEAQVERTPEAVAVVFGSESLSFAELNARANQLAHELRVHGAGADRLVGICVERSLDMVVALLAVVKAGAAYLPLDPLLPRERLSYMLEDSGASLVVTQDSLRTSLPAFPGTVLSLDETSWKSNPRDNPAVAVQPDNLAYLIYTSGSTGRPKGVEVPRGALTNLLWSMRQWLGLTTADRLLAVTTISFDIAGVDMWLPLLVGARLVVASRDEARDGARLRELIDQHGITFLQATPVTWRLLLLAGWKGKPDLQIVCTGEAMPRDLAVELAPIVRRLWNLYGPTETTIWSTGYLVRDGRQPILIGRPVANTQCYILDENARPVPMGVVGELYIGGDGLARGYLGRPELTAEKFLPDPFRSQPGARMYRTGDLARCRADGNIECLGRTDHQVKVHGYRIELGEIEGALARHPAVQQAVVTAREDVPGDKRLVAYLVARNPAADLAGQLRAFLRAELPEYMVPSHFVDLDRFPLTPSGKVDRKALPAPSNANLVAIKDTVGPRNQTEKSLAAIWSELLSVGTVGIHDNFFDLGGHSLLAIKAMSRLRDVFRVNLPLQRLFENPTVAGLAAVVMQAKGAPEEVRRIEPRRQSGPCPLSFAQEQFWLLDQTVPAGSPAYNIVDVIAIRGAYDASALKSALDELVRRHEILRTSISLIDGRLMQIVSPASALPLPEIDLTSLPEPERIREWTLLMREEGQKAFDLSQLPLLRATVIHQSEHEHKVLLVIHHIVADEWAMELIEDEVKELYAAFSRKRPSPLPELPVQYADFACWQRDWFQGEKLEEQIAYWKKELEGASPMLALPTDKPRPRTQTFQGATEHFALPKPLLQGLRSLGQQEQATLFMLLEAAFATLLHRYSGQADILVGTPISGRTQQETERLVGCFLNTVVLRSQFTAGQTFRGLLHEARAHALGAFAHAELPFGRLVATVAPDRDPSRTPLFQVMFVLHDPDAASQGSNLPGHRVLETGTSKFDLTLYVSVTEDGLQGVMEYSTDLFAADTVRRLCRHFGALLQAIVRDPDQSISRLPMLAEADRQQLLVEWNDTAVAFPETGLCLRQMFERQAERTPDDVAVICGADTLTYGELDRRSNQLAHHLMGLGVGPDVLVGLLVERSPEMVVALLAILKAGGAYVPLDPAFPPDRLTYMVGDSRMPVLITHGELDQALGSRPAAVVRLDHDWSEVAKHGMDAPATRGLRPDHLAYVLYTSGSTGLPKGVAIPHSAIVNFLLSMQREPGFTATDTVLAVTTLSFDIAGLELYLPLVSGGKVVIASRDDALDPYRLMERMRESACTVMQATPATWRALVSAGWGGTPGLRVLCGGESMPPDLAKALLPRCAELWNMYGPTETTVWSTVYRITSADGQAPIGRPIANTQTYVLNQDRELVPPGVVGELYIGGDGLARGYLHRPELTRERFVSSPFTPDALLYRTGDLARWRPDGLLECLGRTDHQVKIRGYRIELEEIEGVLARHPAVKQVVVMAREDVPGDKRLVAYLIAETPPSDLVDQLRGLLRAALPEYMVPAHFVDLDAFPLTPNGKVDRKALPAPAEANVVAIGETVGPRNQTEASLVAVWSELLSVGKVSIHDNFFDLGGHSLLAIKAISRVRDVFQVDLPLRRLFENPTVAGLAAVVMQAKGAPEEVRRIEPRRQSGPCPLSFAQEQFWLLDQMVPPGSPAYNIVDEIGIDGAYDASALKSALDELVRRHEILRTTFTLIDGRLMQVVSPASDLPLPEIHLTSLPEVERTREWTRLVREQGQKAFDLSQLPLFRAAVVHRSEHEHTVLLVIHHIIADEWAVELIQDEVKELYAAFSRKRPSPLPELSVQYADFACWQRDWFEGEKLEEQIAYWKKELEGASPVLTLPTDKPRPRTQTFRGATEYFAVPKPLLQGLRSLGQQEQATLFMLLEAAFATLLHRYSGQADILVGTPISGRTQSATERLVGCFLNTVVLRSQFTTGQTFRALLHEARAHALGAFAHAELPFGRLVATVAPDRDPSRTPLFQVMFILHDLDAASQGSNGSGHRGLETDTSKFDLTLYASVTEDGLQGVMEYSTDLFEADTVRRLCRYFGVLLEAIVRDPDQSISRLPMLAEAHRQQLLVEWNRTEADYPRDVPLGQLVEAQAEKTPEAAVVFGGESLSFAELNAQANQLAHALRAHGAGPDRLVGICVERSLDMVVALLAVVKAGAAYLPLDPLLPLDRLSYMLKDSGASLVVTQDGLRASLPAFSGTVVSLDDRTWKSNPRDNPAVAVQPDNLAYVMYTSGSTGRPKGVEVPRGPLTNFLWSMRQWLGMTTEDRVLAVTTISFDIAGLEIWLPLLLGARLVVASREEAADGARLRELIDRHGITFLQATPVTWRLLLQAGWNGKPDLQIVCGGEAMPRDLAVELTPIVRRLWNLYGPTETTVWSTGYLVRDGNQPILIGRPVANTQCYILDENAHPVPIGVVGELYIGGDGLARGYLGRPELTAEKFLPDPFRSQPGARMYRTGDLARYWADGNIECLGRTDHQIKIRGLRIEPGEIEAVLEEHPAVRQAVLRVFEPKPGDQRLAAFYLPAPGAEVSATELRKYLRGKLPDYMVPQQFVALESLPLTASGKVDRKALTLPAEAGGVMGERVAPHTPTERFLADLWADLTGSKTESIGANDNFFDVGGHSLLALQAIARIQTRTGVRLEARNMFLNSLGQIAEILAAAGVTGDLPPQPEPNPAAPPGSA